MALSAVEVATINRLTQSLMDAQTPLRLARAYFLGEQRLRQLGLAIPPSLHRFMTIVNWPRMVIEAIEERLDIEGFRFPGVDEADQDLWDLWQDNNLDEESQLAHLDVLTYGRSYACVGATEDDEAAPLITVESPFEMAHEINPRTRQVSAALRLYAVENGRPTKGTLYTPDATVWLSVGPLGTWVEADRDDHSMGVTPVVVLVNRAMTGDRHGSSEMKDLIPLTDAAARALTNLQVAQETHAIPQRFVVGATEGDFVDRDGKPKAKWEAYFSGVWTIADTNAKIGQLPSGDLGNMTGAIEHYARLASAVSGLPPAYFGLAADDASSADAIRSREARLVKRVERKQVGLSGGWEQVMRLAIFIRDGVENLAARRLVTLWRDPATPTKAQQADAAVKLVQANVFPREGAWDEMRLSPARQDRLREQFRRQEEADPVGVLVRQAEQRTAQDAEVVEVA